MKLEDVKVGMKVQIPDRKSEGTLSLAIFENALLRAKYDKDYLIVDYINHLTGQIYLKYDSEISPIFDIKFYPFSSKDLDEYEESKTTDFVEEHNQHVHDEIGENSSHDLNQVGHLAEKKETPKDFSDGEKKHKDWEMGEPALVDSSDLRKEEINPAEYSYEAVKVESKPKEGLRYNEGKTDYTLMDMTAFTPMIEVLEFGAKKYSRNNWAKGGVNFTMLKLLGSTMRHIAQLLKGELYDQESSLAHIGHIQANAMFLGHFWNNHLANKKSKKKTNFLDELYKQSRNHI